MDFKYLRKKYPRFIYKSYFWIISKNNLEIFFDFRIEPDIKFKPKLVIKNIDKKLLERIGDSALDNLVFNLGMVELISYWKATCSQTIEVGAGKLNTQQKAWFKDLIINGMGEFFYQNKINWKARNFVKIVSKSKKTHKPIGARLKKRFLVPMGGGKDSIVTWELLKKEKDKRECFTLNPNKTIKAVMRIAECKTPVVVTRKVDERLLALNRKGYLNGHTPFSAYLAFLTVLAGVIFDYRFITLSNERSSDEGNVKYLGKTINHQYSKSFDFEKKFRKYSKKYLAKDIEYFSFLRPLYELQIAKMFAEYPKYFPYFLSCNEAYKTDSGTKKQTKKWCGACPKCLFVFTALYPFVDTKKLIKIFGKNLFSDKKLLPLMKELIGLKKFKPFECVGTKKESLTAFYLSYKKSRGKKLPYLLNYFEKNILSKQKNLEKISMEILIS